MRNSNAKDLAKYTDVNFNTADEYIKWLADQKISTNALSWQDIVDLVKQKFSVTHSRQWYAKEYGLYVPDRDMDNERFIKWQKTKVQAQDTLNISRAYVRDAARLDTVKEAVEKCALQMRDKLLPDLSAISKEENREKENILIISDWHYGFRFENKFNKFSPEICKQRVSKLLKETIRVSKEQSITKLHVLNLSDMIAGRIHKNILLQSDCDVVTQIMEVSEIIAEFLSELSKHFFIEYYSCSDNHSRIEPKKKESLELEALYRITDWYLKPALKDNNRIHFNDKDFGEDVIVFKVMGHRMCAVHGDKDKPDNAIEKLSKYTENPYRLILMAHFHHFQANEDANTVLICNGSLIGVDPYAASLRLRSKPSQTLITVTKQNPTYRIYKINLDC